MYTTVKLYSNEKNEIFKFLNSFYDFENNILSESNKKANNISVKADDLEWQYNYENPIEMTDIIGTFIDNNDKFKINMWVSIDMDVYINVTDQNADEIIKYLYERFPY